MASKDSILWYKVHDNINIQPSSLFGRNNIKAGQVIKCIKTERVEILTYIKSRNNIISFNHTNVGYILGTQSELEDLIKANECW